MVYTFDDGSKHRVPLADVYFAVDMQHAKMAAHEDAGLRAAGLAAIKKTAEERVAGEVQLADQAFNAKQEGVREVKARTAAKARYSASNKRPAAQSPVRATILKEMRAAKLAGHRFKDFLDAWEGFPVAGLALTLVEGERYEVTEIDGDGARKPYELSTLTTMWSAKLPIKR